MFQHLSSKTNQGGGGGLDYSGGALDWGNLIGNSDTQTIIQVKLISFKIF